MTSPREVTDSRLAALVSAPRGCGSTFDAGVEAADRASRLGAHAREASLLAYTRGGLRDRRRWATLGLREADAWERAGQNLTAHQVWGEIWESLRSWESLPPRFLEMRHKALMSLWRLRAGGAHLPDLEAQLPHLLQLASERRRDSLQALVATWASAGWLDSRRDRVLMRKLGELGRPRRKRKPGTLPGLLDVSPAAQPLLWSLRAEQAMVTAVREPHRGLVLLKNALNGAPGHPGRRQWEIWARLLQLRLNEGASLFSQRSLDGQLDRDAAYYEGEALWLRALAHLKAGRLIEARLALAATEAEEVGRVSEVSMALGQTDPGARALYWLARIDEVMGNREMASVRFDRLGREYPFGLYHLLAVDAFNRIGGAPGQLRVSQRWHKQRPSNTFKPHPTSPAEHAYEAMAIADPGHAFALALDRARYSPLNPGQHERLLELGRAVHSNAELIWVAYTLPPSGYLSPGYGLHGLPFDRPDPRSYRNLVKPAADRWGSDLEWVLALIRQESGFQARVCSGSKACGLMQLKLSAAKMISKARRLPYDGSIEGLFKTETNLMLGTALLEHLEEKFQGDPIRALAAYNAGPGAVRRWGLDPLTLPGDLFLELMPDRRTRSYVVGILVRYGLYSALMDSGRIRTLVTRPMIR